MALGKLNKALFQGECPRIPWSWAVRSLFHALFGPAGSVLRRSGKEKGKAATFQMQSLTLEKKMC